MPTCPIVFATHATASGAGPLSKDDPFGAGREIAWSGPQDLAVGGVAFSGVVDSAAFPHTEVIVVRSGRLDLTLADGSRRTLQAGESIVVARGSALRVEAAPGTNWVFCANTGAASAAPGVTELPADAALSPSSPPPANLLEGPVPQCRSFNAFTDEASRLRAGIWDSTAYRRVLRPQPVNELMHILVGSVTLTGTDGRPVRIAAGESVFVAQGTSCAWDSDEHVAKVYVVQEVGA
ncbi:MULTISPECIES: cupin domain-containing protein [unclassified Bosea (in: a-proteobacteria)]|uniref:cupin domain-containing protein n=1 Tax=unclassified Bosea (in: a-proteobacteria) TaxID=2653178 RepID=UPI00125F4A9E|nr:MULTISPECIES: cupin domain-containing protein [unclassified Bosea (in: a-proteobacteria)]